MEARRDVSGSNGIDHPLHLRGPPRVRVRYGPLRQHVLDPAHRSLHLEETVAGWVKCRLRNREDELAKKKKLMLHTGNKLFNSCWRLPWTKQRTRYPIKQVISLDWKDHQQYIVDQLFTHYFLKSTWPALNRILNRKHALEKYTYDKKYRVTSTLEKNQMEGMMSYKAGHISRLKRSSTTYCWLTVH